MKSVGKIIEMAMRYSSAMDWYARACSRLDDLSEKWDVRRDRLAGVIAVTSPGVTVSQNLVVARRYLEEGIVMHPYGSNVVAALFHFEGTGEIRGPKTAAFCANLNGDWDAITLDRWMARGLKCDERWYAKDRRKAEHRIWQAASDLGWFPAEVQAACWYGAMYEQDMVETVPYM